MTPNQGDSVNVSVRVPTHKKSALDAVAYDKSSAHQTVTTSDEIREGIDLLLAVLKGLDELPPEAEDDLASLDVEDVLDDYGLALVSTDTTPSVLAPEEEVDA